MLQSLRVTTTGLSSTEADQRLQEYGLNELRETQRRTPLQMFLGEFKDVFILLLLVASLFSLAIGYYEYQLPPAPGEAPHAGLEVFADSLIILIIVVLVAVAGFIQEYRAEQALEALKQLTAPQARVLRDTDIVSIPAAMLVPGDILILETGDLIPADARLIDTIEIRTDEAVLTGESTPVQKTAELQLSAATPINDRRNMIFGGTHILYGRGRAVVTATGMQTEFGKIAELVQATTEGETPLQRRLDRFARKIAKVVIGVVVIIFVLEVVEILIQVGSAGGPFPLQSILDTFMTAVSLAVSAVPEGLPAVVTITLALGAREFVKRNAIVRKLSAAEGLGAVTVICSDKTGTLTKGEMTVRTLYLAGSDRYVDVTGVGYQPTGEFRYNGRVLQPQLDPEVTTLLRIGALCNNAGLNVTPEGLWTIRGDPTEGALLVAEEKTGNTHQTLLEHYPRLDEVPFTSERKFMMTLHQAMDQGIVGYLKGAPEVIVARCSQLLQDNQALPLTPTVRTRILDANASMARSALRVLAMAYKLLPEKPADVNGAIDDNWVFVGLVGIMDPPREEAITATARCRAAGITPVMITGDHQLTATAVAREVGILTEDRQVLTGVELDGLSEDDLTARVDDIAVYARVSPEHKLRIVNALQRQGQIVAMTGDGVNDAPALQQADIGVAMGITGTDVSKEAADVILTDDNFATIVKAVEQGRVIYDNIRKYIRFLIATNFDELLVIGSFAILGGLFGVELFPLPMLPAMILWVNLVTDGAPAIALAVDAPEGDVMARAPRQPDEGILHGMGAFITVSFLLQSLGSILVFSLEYYVWPTYGFGTEATLAVARTATFVQTVMFELFSIWNCRSETRSIWRMGRDALRNRFLFLAVTLSAIASIGIVYLPVTANVFGFLPLPLPELALSIGMGSLGLLVLPELFMGRRVGPWA